MSEEHLELIPKDLKDFAEVEPKREQSFMSDEGRVKLGAVLDLAVEDFVKNKEACEQSEINANNAADSANLNASRAETALENATTKAAEACESATQAAQSAQEAATEVSKVQELFDTASRKGAIYVKRGKFMTASGSFPSLQFNNTTIAIDIEFPAKIKFHREASTMGSNPAWGYAGNIPLFSNYDANGNNAGFMFKFECAGTFTYDDPEAPANSEGVGTWSEFRLFNAFWNGSSVWSNAQVIRAYSVETPAYWEGKRHRLVFVIGDTLWSESAGGYITDVRLYNNELQIPLTTIGKWASPDYVGSIATKFYMGGHVGSAAHISNAGQVTASPIDFKIHNYKIFNFEIDAENAPYSLADFAAGKLVPPALRNATSEEKILWEMADYTYPENSSTRLILDESGNGGNATITGDIAGDKDGASDVFISKLKEQISQGS